MKKLFAILLIFTAAIFTSCVKDEDTPNDAISEIQIALAERNLQKLSSRIDLEDFFKQIYEAGTVEFFQNYDYYKEKYPKEPYFQKDAEYLKQYNENFETQNLKFAEDVTKAYFAKIPAPEKAEENPAAYVANEFEKIRRAVSAEIKSVAIDNDSAEMILNLNGDSTVIGQFVSDLDLKLGFIKDKNGNWHLNKIENIDVLTPLIVDKAEIIRENFF